MADVKINKQIVLEQLQRLNGPDSAIFVEPKGARGDNTYNVKLKFNQLRIVWNGKDPVAVEFLYNAKLIGTMEVRHCGFPLELVIKNFDATMHMTLED